MKDETEKPSSFHPSSVILHPSLSGSWAVGVSGGADSVVLLHLLCDRGDIQVHVVHLDHELRGSESAGDAQFVKEFAQKLGVPVTIARRSEIEPSVADLPENPSARYRALRLELFRRVIAEHGLDGVILAHHADDQAETVMLRLMRGSGLTALAGMRESTVVGGVVIQRPLLGVTRKELREFLAVRGIAWREDSSNVSEDYQRNRVRKIMSDELREAMIELGSACAVWKTWLNEVTPVLGESFLCRELADQPMPLARAAAARWLVGRGCAGESVSGEVCERLIEMASDAATPARQHFPGKVLVGRRAGRIAVLTDSPRDPIPDA